MCLWFPPARRRAALLPLPPPPRRRPSVSRSKSGTPSPSGPGILLSITARFAGIILWISVLSAKLTKLAPPARNALLLGGFVTTHFTFTASADGLRLVKCVHWITVNGSFRSMATRIFGQLDSWNIQRCQHELNICSLSRYGFDCSILPVLFVFDHLGGLI